MEQFAGSEKSTEVVPLTRKELESLSTQALVFPECGGNIQEWIDGVNEMLTEDGILLEGDVFSRAYQFQNKGRTCLAFDLTDVKVDFARLPTWRIGKNRQTGFGIQWLNEYLEREFGIRPATDRKRENNRPDCVMEGVNRNVYRLRVQTRDALRANGMHDAAEEFLSRADRCGSYKDVLSLIEEYVKPVDHDGEPFDLAVAGAGQDMDDTGRFESADEMIAALEQSQPL